VRDLGDPTSYATQVDRLRAGGVVLTLDAVAAEPSEHPAVLEADPGDTAPDDLGDKLERAWAWLSGNS
jgi:hypothetical protein